MFAYTQLLLLGVRQMLTMLCVDSDPQRLSEIKQDLFPLNATLKLVEATTLKEAQQLILEGALCDAAN